MRTNIEVDEALVRRAARLKEQERIRRYRGKLLWRGDLDSSRRSRMGHAVSKARRTIQRKKKS